MNETLMPWIAWDLALHLAGAAGFLLLGWRLGRESAGRPMFDYPTRSTRPSRPEADAPLDRRPAMVDIFETLAPRRPFNADQATP